MDSSVTKAPGHGHSCQQPYFQMLSSKLSSKDVLYSLAFVLFVLVSVIHYRLRRRTQFQHFPSGSPTPATPVLEKADGSTAPASSKSTASSRKPGTWTPSDFVMPTPEPYPDWNITATKPLPYRPFRHGPKYFITMGLRNEQHENWIELDSDYPRFHADKARRIAERGAKCSRTAPEAMPAALEFLDELVTYLCARYPTLYRRTETGIENLWSGEKLNTTSSSSSAAAGGPLLDEDPMQLAARLVQDDLAIMIERADGQYYLLAGSILLPGFWRLSDKFGMPLSEIHTSGDVPGFREKLERGMLNFFRRLKPEEMVARNNYFVQVDDDLAWSPSIGREDDEHVSWDTAEQDRAIAHHHFRSERQTLRRLPKTGAVVFTIRTYFCPITDIAAEDYVPGRLASAVRSWGDDVSRYKGKSKYQRVLLEYLDRKHQEQIERGLDVEKEDEVRAYPY